MVDEDSLIVHVEICQKQESSLDGNEIQRELDKYLTQENDLPLDKLLLSTVLPEHISYVRLCSSVDDLYKVDLSSEKVMRKYYVYQAWGDGPQVDSLDEDNDEVPASLNWCLPNTSFEGLWESLVLENGIKDKLLNYVQTTLQFSDKGVNAQVVHWNGVILLHGPPGSVVILTLGLFPLLYPPCVQIVVSHETKIEPWNFSVALTVPISILLPGKTSLCKALAQKLSIRLNSKYKTTQLLEINTHSLFSKWFSESAKLVLKMFSSVRQWLQSSDNFVCILIDEVESLAHVRSAKGTEPSDSIRVVNAVLTQIDQLQKYPNVLILATSNVTSTIDVAFADRADLKLFVPHPSKWGVYEILKSCIEELIRCELVDGDEHEFFEAGIYKRLISNQHREGDGDAMNMIMQRSRTLMYISALCDDLSGRTLRKIPFLTSAKFVNKSKPKIDKFLDALRVVICSVKEENEKFFRIS